MQLAFNLIVFLLRNGQLPALIWDQTKEKNGFISNNIANFLEKYIEWYFYFPLYAWCKIIQSQGSVYDFDTI